jgi:hypothetical protein
MTRPWTERFTIQIPAGVRDFSLFQNIQTSFGTHPTSYLMGTGVSFPRRKAASAEIKNEWDYAYTPPVCFHGVYKDSFTLYVFSSDLSS